MAQASKAERRRLRRGSRRRRRGGDKRAPVAVQQAAEAAGRGLAAARRGVRSLQAAATGGDRPLIAGLLVVVVLAAVAVSGPVQNYLDARGRVTTLQAQAQALGEANGELRQQVQDLRDPEHLELLAREEFGMVRPGQVSYVVVPPEADRPRITEPVEADGPDGPWYERMWNRLADVMR